MSTIEPNKLGEGLSIIWGDDELDKHAGKEHKLQAAFGFERIYEAANIEEAAQAFKQAHKDGAKVAFMITDLQLGQVWDFSGYDMKRHLEEGGFNQYYPDADKLPSIIMCNNLEYRERGIYKGDFIRLSEDNISTNLAGIAVTNLICAYRGVALPQSSPNPHPVNPPEGFAGFEEAKHVTRAREKFGNYIDHGDWNLRLLRQNAADKNKPRTPEK